jgi:hypothetical protein
MTRFVLLTTPRCGASLLITALNQNPAIACAGQKLAVYGEGPDHFPARLALPGFWDDSHWAGTAAVGFHARLHHLDDDDWDYLLRQDVSFVLLSRVDLMGQLVSDYLVTRLGGPQLVPSCDGIDPAHPSVLRYPRHTWGAIRDVPPFRLSPAVVRRHIPVVQSLYRSARRRLSDACPRWIDLTYEELVRSYEIQSHYVMSFLDAWPSGLTLDVQTQRQAQRPWIEQITNWDEILEDARGTALYHTLSRNPIDRLLRGAVVSRAADPIPGNEVLIA